MNIFVEWMTKLFEFFPVKNRGTLEFTLFLIPLFPLLGFLLNGLFGRRMDKSASGWIGVIAALFSFLWATVCVGAVNVLTFSGPDTRNALHAVYGEWFSTDIFSCSFGLYLDQLSSVMILVVTGIGTLIHIYSMGYMAHDPGFSRFFAYLNLFLFSMIVLVLGDNLIMTFVGWEGVGLCSYLLIGFWYEEGKNAAAGMKAFVVNRIGDLGFLLGIFTLVALFGTVNFVAKPEPASPVDSVTQLKWTNNGRVAREMVLSRHTVTRQTHVKENAFVELPASPGLLDYGEAIRKISMNHPSQTHLFVGGRTPADSNLDLTNTAGKRLWPDWTLPTALTLACVLLFVGAIGKSAQIPLYVWLPDAMAGPTPVSALIHAATMVTAGVYMVVRMHSLFAVSPDALKMVAVIGGCTALFSALIGLTQLDIKKVLAYSTVSQLGYMFLGLGVGFFSLGIFHVVTHAFFKALLFLGAGSVIHAMSGEQDMRYMGGLRKKLPVTFWTMLIGACALAGLFPFAGFWSKDNILAETLARYEDTHDKIYLMLYVFGCAGAFCTAFYTFRLIGLTFFGENRAKPEVQAHIHESPASMTVPLVVLAAFSFVGGMLWLHTFTDDAAVALGIHNVEYATLSHEQLHHAHTLNLVVTTAIALAGIGFGLLRYGKGQNVPNPEGSQNFLYRLSLNKFYVDETYNALIITPFIIGSEIVHWLVEMLFIDLLVTGVGYGVSFLSGILRRMQTGLVNTYAFFIFTGALAVLLYLLKR